MRAPNLPVLFHPDCNRRLRNRTESADPADCAASARGLWRALAITAGGDFHPALRTRSDRNPTDAINTPLAKPRNDFPPARLHGFGVREVTDRARWLERRDKNRCWFASVRGLCLTQQAVGHRLTAVRFDKSAEHSRTPIGSGAKFATSAPNWRHSRRASSQRLG